MGAEYRFCCSECETDVVVDEPVRADLLQHGCLVCGASVTSEEFEPAEETRRQS